jgi:ornithine cyclodeaminase
MRRVVGLERIVTGQLPGRSSAQDITLFSSVGLSGTEVILANHVIAQQREAARA